MRRLTASAVMALLLAVSSGTGVAAASSGTTPAPSAPAPESSAAGASASHTAGDPTCDAEILDPAGVLSGDDVEQLRLDAQDLAQTTVLRLRTVSSVPGGDLNAYEEQLQQSCDWADAANVREPTLLVVMVDTDDRRIGIYPGPSLTPVVTDSVWLAIEQDHMRGPFAAGDWVGGLQAGVDALAALVGPGASDFADAASAPAPASASDGAAASDGAGTDGVLPGDGSANGAGAVDQGSGFSGVGPAIGIVALLAVFGVIAAVARGGSGRRSPHNGFWDGGSQHPGGFGGHGFGGGDGGGGGAGGSSSDGGGGSSSF